MKKHHHDRPIHAQPVAIFTPLPEDIAQRARALWIEFGCPKNRDEAIWLEAEGQLVAVQRRP